MDQSLVARDSESVGKRALPRTLNIATISPGQKFGSYEEQLVLLSRAFMDEGSLFLPMFNTPVEKSDVAMFAARGVDAVCLDISSFNAHALKALRGIIAEHDIAAINWNFTHPLNLFYESLRVTNPGVQHWFTDHISRYDVGPAKQKPLIKKAVHRMLLAGYSKVICVSEFVKEQSVATGAWQNQLVARHFINADRFTPDATVRKAVREETGTVGKFIVLCVAHLISEKGVDVAVRAMRGLPQDTILWVLGDGSGRQTYEKLAVDLGLDGRVRFWGLRSDVQRFMQAADCFVCPSIWHEAAGLVNLEAQASGLPVVASRIGGIPEYVCDGLSGLLFEPGNSDDLCRQVGKLAGDGELSRRMGQAAVNWVAENFSTQTGLPRILDIYRG